MAVEVRYVGTRGRDDWVNLQLQRVQHRRERVPERVPAGAGEPAGEHRGRPRQPFAYTGAAGHGAAADFLAYFNGQPAAQCRRRGALHGANWTNATFLELPGGQQSEPVRLRVHAARPTACWATRRSAPTRRAAGLPANFFVANPDLLGGADRDVPTWPDAATTRSSSSSAAASRRGSSSTPATRSASVRQRLHESFRREPQCYLVTPARRVTSRTRSRRTSSTTCRSAGPALRRQRERRRRAHHRRLAGRRADASRAAA